MVSSDLLLMLLADARLPTAGHTQSAQLEPAVTAGLGAAEVPAFMDLRLRTVTRVEAATAVVALHHFRVGLALDPVELAWAARTPSAAMRATSRTMGRALGRIVRRLWPEHPAVRAIGAGGPQPGRVSAPVAGETAMPVSGAVSRASRPPGSSPVPTPPRAVVLAAAADACALSPLALARLVGYDDVQTVAAAALKLLPLDPAEVARWVLAALPAVDELAAEVAYLTSPGEIPAAGAPLIEAWAQAHATAPRRLFSA